jgi:hypothetical protein
VTKEEFIGRAADAILSRVYAGDPHRWTEAVFVAEAALEAMGAWGLYEALLEAAPYVAGAYECAFPDEHENARVYEAALVAITKAEGR